MLDELDIKHSNHSRQAGFALDSYLWGDNSNVLHGLWGKFKFLKQRMSAD